MDKKQEVTLGTVKHTITVDENRMERDRFEVIIPIDCLEKIGQDELFDWCVEDFYRAEIVWSEGKIKLYYHTDHYLPEGYTPEPTEDLNDFLNRH